MATALDLITDALQTSGEVGQGLSISPEDAAYCLARLNSMLGKWSSERLNIPVVSVASYNLTTTKAAYSIGVSGSPDINAARPTFIESAGILIASPGGSGTLRKPVRIVGQLEWALITQKAAKSVVATILFCDYAYPNSNLNLWPTPTFAVITPKIELYTWAPIAQVASLVTVLNWPDGYYEAVMWSLIEQILLGYNKPVDQQTTTNAANAVRAIQSLNAQHYKLLGNQPPGQQQQQQQPPVVGLAGAAAGRMSVTLAPKLPGEAVR